MRAKYRESKVGGGGGGGGVVAELSTKKSVDSSKFFFRRIPRSRKIRRFGQESFFYPYTETSDTNP